MPRPSVPVPADLPHTARRQSGLITREQARAAGVSAEQIDGHLRANRWYRVAPRVYATSAAPPTTRQLICAVWLWAGPSSVILGNAALFWQRRRLVTPRVIDIAVTKHLRPPELPLIDLPDDDQGSPWARGFTPRPAGPISECRRLRVVAHRRHIDEIDIVGWDRIWTARTEHAVYDLLPTEGPRLLDDAIRLGWVTLPLVQQLHRRSRGRRGAARSGEILSAATSGGISEGERLLHRYLKIAGITGWRANPTVRVDGRTMKGDTVFDDLRLIIEIDGFAFHSSHARFHDDRSRQNVLVGADWTVLRFTWWHLANDPDDVIRQIKKTIAMLAQRSG